jgi:hypothetical protein
MSESHPTGYRESPDTTDGPAADDQTGDAPGGSATLTTDDDAQDDDGIVRPGNLPDCSATQNGPRERFAGAVLRRGYTLAADLPSVFGTTAWSSARSRVRVSP